MNEQALDDGHDDINYETKSLRNVPTRKLYRNQ